MIVDKFRILPVVKLFKIFILLIFLPGFLTAQYDNIKFERLASYEGFSNVLVQCIEQDKKGFMWFGTIFGLYKYDGYSFSGYFQDPENQKSISHNWANSILEDRAGNLWIGTLGGLNKYNPATEKFTQYLHESENPNSLGDNYIMPALFEDHNGDLWIGTQKGVSRIIFSKSDSNTTETKFINYLPDPGDINSLSHGTVWSIYEDVDYNIWIGTDDGTLHKYDRIKDKFIRVVTITDLKENLGPKWSQVAGDATVYIGHHPDDSKNILTIATDGYIYKYDYNSNKIINFYNQLADLIKKKSPTSFNNILIDKNRSTWIATDNGCYIISKPDNQIYFYNWKRNDPTSLSLATINKIYQDRQGIIWLGQNSRKGITKYDPSAQNFESYKVDIDTTYYSIYSLYEESTDNGSILWLGAVSEGLLKFNRKTKQIKRYKVSHTGKFMNSICQSPTSSNYLWIGTTGGGLIKFNKQTGISKRILYRIDQTGIPENGYRKGSGDELILSSLQFDQDGQLWIGSARGLYKFDTRTNKSIPFLHDPANKNSISANDISALCKSHKNKSVMWIGTWSSGLNKLDLSTGLFTRFKNNPDDSLSLNDNYISTIFEDKSGILWIGTHKGLNRFNHQNNTFIRIMDKDKILNSEVQSIQKDNNDKLWLNTYQGFGKFDPNTNILRLYYGKFSRWAYYKNRSGELFYANGNVVTSFYPEKMRYNNYVPPIVLTDFQLFNERVKIGPTDQSILQKSISETNELNLSYDQSVFSFEFAALDYSEPLKNKYAYKMEGVDPDWVNTDASRRYVTYTNLDPGEYVFKVKGSNNDGVWNEEGTSIKIIITPPWWKTDLAYPIYALIFVITLIGIIRYETKRQRRIAEQKLLKEREQAQLREANLRAETAELQARALESEQDAEKERIRSRIAGDLHDEIGSNLSSIAMISENLEKKKFDTDRFKKRLKDIQHISRLTAESMRDIVWFVNPENDDPQKLISKMRQTAGRLLEMEFNFSGPKEMLTLNMNLDLRRNLFLIYKEILHNILKHSQAKRVDIRLSQKDHVLTLEVIDNGIGFNPSEVKEGNGLNNFRRRTQHIGGNLDISSAPYNGTKIKISIKIP
jgi:signal transduction histidine kinase/ligand-binding sensor domain-containing protein